MAEGIEAVKVALGSQFGPVNIEENYDVDTQDTALSFNTEGRGFEVRVARLYDRDYASSRRIKVDLKRLGMLLRASDDGKMSVRNEGMVHQQVA